MNAKSPPEYLEDLQRMDMAAEWVLLLRQEPVKDEDIASWLLWCEADPRNHRAFERARKLFGLTRLLSAHDIGGDAATTMDLPAAAHAAPGGAARASGRRTRTPRLAHRHWRLALAGAAALLVAIGFERSSPRDAETERAAATASDAAQTTRLPDGSSMELAAKTIVAINYTEQQRSLELGDGEAYFSVAPNKQRPFVVAAGEVRVRAVGTAFNVRRAGERVVVTVTQGKVDVYRSGDGSADNPVRVAAGGQLVWGGERKAPQVASIDPATALAWREGRLEYAAEPLDAVIADLNRYSRLPVLVSGEPVKKLRFTGTVFTRSIDEWLHALPGNFPVQVRERDGRIVVSAQEPAPRR